MVTIARPARYAVARTIVRHTAKRSSLPADDIYIRCARNRRIEGDVSTVRRPSGRACRNSWKRRNLTGPSTVAVAHPYIVLSRAIRYEDNHSPIGRDFRTMILPRGGDQLRKRTVAPVCQFETP